MVDSGLRVSGFWNGFQIPQFWRVDSAFHYDELQIRGFWISKPIQFAIFKQVFNQAKLNIF